MAPEPISLSPTMQSKPGQSKPGALAGKQLGHFQLERRLAEGGMGEVYLGFDLALGRRVAIKVIRPELAQDPAFLTIFLREAQAQANVVHSHVLQAYYVGEAEGIWFLAMQVAEGGSLAELGADGKHVSWKVAAKHMTSVVSGMAEAARLGIIHRDIKPANILLDRFGDAHVADFGLATSTGLLPTKLGEPATGQGTRQPGTTSPGLVMGTPEYMSPEQLHGRVLDERADIYAIGITFYQVLAGKLPYPIDSPASAAAALKGPEATPLRKLRPDVPRAFADLVDRCFRRDLSARPASHAELLGQLNRVGPRPEITPSPVVRALSLVLDLIPFAAALPLTYLRAPGLAFAVLVLWLGCGLTFLSATPGQWLMRLWLRSGAGSDVPLGRLFLRSMLQLGWLLPGSLFLSLAYRANPVADAVGWVGLIWAVAAAVSALPVLGKRRQTLYDRVTGTRVLVPMG